MSLYMQKLWNCYIRFLLSRILMITGLSRFLTIKQRGFILKFHPSNLSAALWADPNHVCNWVHGGYEEFFFRSYLRDGDIAIDVGANIGFTTLVMAVTVTSHGKVYAIEAHPRTFQYLQSNVAANGITNVHLFNVAAGESNGEVFFTDKYADDRNLVMNVSTKLRVPLVRLDELGIAESNIDLLKIDVEGYEKFVLLGATKILGQVECVYFESLEEHCTQFGHTCSDVLKLLMGQGFQIFKPMKTGTLSPIKSDHASLYYENFVAVRDVERFIQRTGFRLQ